MSVLKSKGSKSSDKQFAPRTNGISDNESEDGPWLTTIGLSRHETRNGSDNNMNGWGQHAYMLILCESNVISWSRVGSPLLYFQSILLYSCLFCVAASFFWRHHYHQPRPKRCYWQSSSTTGCHRQHHYCWMFVNKADALHCRQSTGIRSCGLVRGVALQVPTYNFVRRKAAPPLDVTDKAAPPLDVTD